MGEEGLLLLLLFAGKQSEGHGYEMCMKKFGSWSDLKGLDGDPIVRGG